MDSDEVISLINKIQAVSRWIPKAFGNLQFSLVNAQLDLVWFEKKGEKNKNFDVAVAFAQTIPAFTDQDFDSAEFQNWVKNDKEHLKYLKETWLS